MPLTSITNYSTPPQDLRNVSQVRKEIHIQAALETAWGSLLELTMSDEMYLTAEGAERLRIELAYLKNNERIALAKRLRSAIQEGDLSENADYAKAKEDQSFLEGRIQDLEYTLKNAIIIAEANGPRQTVEVGASVTVQEADTSPEIYMLVGVKEADPRNGKISNESPIGRALIGHRPGDLVTVETPSGTIELKIIKVE